MSEHSVRTDRTESRAGAGVAGVGGGTFLAVVATELPETNPFKIWLLYLVPSVSVLLSAVWMWVQVQIANFLKDNEFRAVMKAAKNELEEALDNRNTTEEHKKEIRERLEALEKISVDRVFARLKNIKIATEHDFSNKVQQESEIKISTGKN